METRIEEYGNLEETMFKSYYVVWKQKNVRIDFKTVQLFKSYYVVWKLLKDTRIRRRILGLNRTM